MFTNKIICQLPTHRVYKTHRNITKMRFLKNKKTQRIKMKIYRKIINPNITNENQIKNKKKYKNIKIYMQICQQPFYSEQLSDSQ